MKKIVLLIVCLVFVSRGDNVFAGIVTTACPDTESGKYNHCRPLSRGCHVEFEDNRDGLGNTNQDCTSRLFPSGGQEAICCRLKDLSVYTPAIGTCPTIRSDGYLNYCKPGGSCGSYTATTTADNDACREYLYNATSPLPPAVCCKSTFSVPLVATGSALIKGRYYIDINEDKVFNTGDGKINNESIRLRTGESTTSDAEGNYEISNAPVGGNTIYFNFSKGGNPKEFEDSITIPDGGITYDFIVNAKKDGGTATTSGAPVPGSDSDIKKVIDLVSEVKIREYMSKLVDDDSSPQTDQSQTRRTGTGGNNAEAAYIKSHFESLGLATVYQPFSVGGVSTNNVIATLPGSSSDVYIITSHMDSISPGGSAPGADDNGSGTVLVMEAARVLKESGITPKKTIKFVTFSGEEQGLHGSYYYVNASAENILGVANVDMIGNPTGSSECVVFKYGEGGLGSALAAKVVDVNNMYNIGLNVTSEFEVNNRSDHWPFQTRGKQAAFGHECTFSPVYHRSTDTMDYISFSQITKTTKTVAGAIAILSNE